MSVLWSKVMFEVLVRSTEPIDLGCPLCKAHLCTLPPGEHMFGELANLAHHQCPNAWDVLERHLLDNTGTIGYVRNGVPDPIPPQAHEPGSYREATHRSRNA